MEGRIIDVDCVVYPSTEFDPRAFTHEHAGAARTDDIRRASHCSADISHSQSIHGDRGITLADDGVMGDVLRAAVILKGIRFARDLESFREDIRAEVVKRAWLASVVTCAEIHFRRYFRHHPS
jgi:hypothetical protein